MILHFRAAKLEFYLNVNRISYNTTYQIFKQFVKIARNRMKNLHFEIDKKTQST